MTKLRVINYLLLASLLAFLSLQKVVAQSLRPEVESGHVVTVYVDGQAKSVVTPAKTVEALLKELHIRLDEGDKTEPAAKATVRTNGFSINVYRARPITVVDGANSHQILTAERSPRAIAQEANVNISPNDEIIFQRSEQAFEGVPGTQVVVKRSKTISLSLYGKLTELTTRHVTIGDLLQERGLRLGNDDETNYPLATPLQDGLRVVVDSVSRQPATEELEVPFPTEEIRDAQQPNGYRKIKEPGVTGRKVVAYEFVSRNGGLPEKVIKSEVVTKQPVRELVIVGAQLPTPTNPTEAQQIGHDMMLAAGFGEDQWPCLYNLWLRESGWRTTAGNPSSGAYGIPQSLPASKMAAYGSDYLTNPRTQIAWGLSYVRGRYATPCGAWSSFQAKGWY